MSVSSPLPKPLILSPQQIYEIARGAGFPQKLAVTMTAIALRESGGNPDVHNTDAATGDDSYGLWQINLKDPQVRADIANAGLISSTPDALLDPGVNAKAAFILYAGKTSNINIAWYINKGGDYQTRYESHLPTAQAAALTSGI
jgi:hypothetical protein